MDKRQAKMLRQVRPAKKHQKPRNDQHHWCRAVLENGTCPKCADKDEYRIYCNRCMHIHVADQSCRAWKIRELANASDKT